MNTNVSVSVDSLIAVNQQLDQFSNDISIYSQKAHNDVTLIIQNCFSKMNSVEDELNQIQNDILKNEHELSNVESEIHNNKMAIIDTNREISDTQKNIEYRKSSMQGDMQRAQEAGRQSDYYQGLANSAEDPMERNSYIAQATQYANLSNELEVQCRYTEAEINAMQGDILRLKSDLNTLEDASSRLDEKKKETERIIRELKDKENATQDRLIRLQQAFSSFESSIQYFDNALEIYFKKCDSVSSRSAEAVSRCIRYIQDYESVKLC